MNKEKLVKIKKKIKDAAPTIIIATSAATIGIGIAVHTIKTAGKTTAKAALEDKDFAMPTITGEEKQTILGRNDTILQQIEDDLYFLSVGVTKTES